jgi:hypothetical protein
MTHNTPRVGDTARVVLEGEVTYIFGDYFDIADSNSIYVGADHVKSIEVLTPPVKVGDTVIVSKIHDNLPVGAVVKALETLVKFTDDLWHDPANGRSYTHKYMEAPRTVVYLPEPK